MFLKKSSVIISYLPGFLPNTIARITLPVQMYRIAGGLEFTEPRFLSPAIDIFLPLLKVVNFNL